MRRRISRRNPQEAQNEPDTAIDLEGRDSPAHGCDPGDPQDALGEHRHDLVRFASDGVYGGAQRTSGPSVAIDPDAAHHDPHRARHPDAGLHDPTVADQPTVAASDTTSNADSDPVQFGQS